LLRQIVLTHNKAVQQQYIDKTYRWFYKKLETVGMLSAAEKEAEDLFLNHL
jgi:hypothetical protein